MIKLSIIIPTFNSSETLLNALRSILGQTFTDFELLIIDSLSTDNTVSIAKGFNDKRIKIYSEKDNGIYDAMNKGIEKAKGEWLYFLGSDDELFDQNVLADFYKETMQSNKEILYGNVILNGDTGWGVSGQVYDGIFNLKKLLQTNIAHQAIFYRKEVFDNNNTYNLAYKICADYDFNLRIWSKYRVYYFDKIIAKFNAGGASTSIRDVNFEANFSINIIKYFYKILYRTDFQRFEIDIIKQAKENFKQLKFLQATYLSVLGIYFKLRRKLLR